MDNQQNDNNNNGVINQDQILPGTIKQRHLAATPTIASGDMYYGDGGNNFVRIPGSNNEGSIMMIFNGHPDWNGEITGTLITSPTITNPTINGAVTGTAGFNAWSDFIPSWTNLSVGNGTVMARYNKLGKVVNYYIELTFGSTTSVSGLITVSIPVTARLSTLSVDPPFGNVLIRDASASLSYKGILRVGSSTTGLVASDVVNGTSITCASTSATSPITFTTSDVISIIGMYEAA